jgi:hypothetical protein
MKDKTESKITNILMENIVWKAKSKTVYVSKIVPLIMKLIKKEEQK